MNNIIVTTLHTRVVNEKHKLFNNIYANLVLIRLLKKSFGIKFLKKNIVKKKTRLFCAEIIMDNN